ncbi:MAG: cation diffusion facilitator family transporter [Acidimicrobiales bacterium]|nr:cation diffusion facilitator family transporter [Acidimicrobiales bacterium]
MTSREVSARRERRLRLVLVLNLMIVGGEATAGLIVGSIGLLADAGHNLVDVGGIALALLAVRWSRRTPDAARSFGYHRTSVLAAQANAAAILITTAVITYESVRRLINPEPLDGGVVVVVALIALLVNGFSALLLRERDSHDANMRAAVLHMAADAAASLGVVVAGVVILIADGADRVDPIVSLLISVLIAWQAWKLLRTTGDVLLESTPRGLDVDDVAAAILAVDGVEAVHDLHVWSLSSEVRALSAHVIVEGHPSLEDAQQVATRVKAAVSAPFSIAHATIELECEGCVDNGAWCAIEGLDVHASGGHHH